MEDRRWRKAGLGALAERAANAALLHLGLNPKEYSISLLGCDDARISALNAEFRGMNSHTNVLSWPAEDLSPRDPSAMPALPGGSELGDIAISYETCMREAKENGMRFADHACHLIVHSVLHLLGYCHNNEQDAVRMEKLEAEILATLGLPDPY